MKKQVWRFYVMPDPYTTITVKFVECRAPARTNLYKELQAALAKGSYLTNMGRKEVTGVGYELVEAII